MKKVKLTQGKYALVDNENFDLVSQWKWYYSVTRKGCQGYAVRKPTSGIIYMHRFIVRAKCGEEVDHINRNKLDNRKSNLRIVDGIQNHWNVNLRKDNTSGYKGVSFDRSRNRFYAYIGLNGKMKNLGRFSTPQQAALTYNNAAKSYFGSFARLNKLYN
jgi:hypothetical protein